MALMPRGSAQRPHAFNFTLQTDMPYVTVLRIENATGATIHIEEDPPAFHCQITGPLLSLYAAHGQILQYQWRHVDEVGPVMMIIITIMY